MTELTSVERLENALAIVSDPAKFTTKQFAKNAAGKRTYVYGDEAVCFCAIGALRYSFLGRVYTDLQMLAYLSLRAVVIKVSERQGLGANLAEINDGPEGQARVVAVFQETLNVLRKEEAER